MQIRDATAADVPVLTAIYAHHVLHGTGTFEEEPPNQEEIADRLARVQQRGWAWLVAESGILKIVTTSNARGSRRGAPGRRPARQPHRQDTAR